MPIPSLFFCRLSVTMPVPGTAGLRHISFMTIQKSSSFTPDVVLSLAAVYLVWGSTYLAIRLALVSLPPFLMAGTRFAVAGAALFAFLRWRGAPAPTRQQWLSAALIGALLLGGGNGGVVFAEQWVSSSLAAALIATTPLWAVVISGALGKWPTRFEWVGLVIGFAGVVILNLEGELRANPLGAVALMMASLSWSFGSVLSQRLKLPPGMMGSAAEMLCAAPLLLLAGLLRGEHIVWPIPTPALWAWLYLVSFGSIVGFGAYMYLLSRVRIALATSYAYVNPVVALMLGVLIAGERVTRLGLIGIGVILVGVIVIVLGRSLRKN